MECEEYYYTHRVNADIFMLCQKNIQFNIIYYKEKQKTFDIKFGILFVSGFK